MWEDGAARVASSRRSHATEERRDELEDLAPGKGEVLAGIAKRDVRSAIQSKTQRCMYSMAAPCIHF